MFTKTTCLTLFVLAVSLGSSKACLQRSIAFSKPGLSGKCCKVGTCMYCEPCSEDPVYGKSIASAAALAAPSAAPSPAAPAPAPAAVIADTSPSCPIWAAEGQCTSNPAYMLTACAVSCSSFSLAAAAAPIPSTTSCDQRNVDYSNRQNCCRCENQFARRLRGARKLGLLGNTISATTSVATDAGKATVAANSLYNDQLPCC